MEAATSAMAQAEADSGLVLDWRIRVWVLVPITAATLLMAVLRHNFVALLVQPPRVDLFKVRDASALRSAEALRRSAHMLHPAQFEARRKYLAAPDGPLRKAPATSQSPLSFLMNPESLGNQVAGLLSSTVPSMLLGTWARYLFGGFAVCRLPFPLSPRFRSMLQVGIERAGQSLDVRYVSALSWYVINLLGTSSLVQLLPIPKMKMFDALAGADPTAGLMAAQLSSAFKGFNDARESEQVKLSGFVQHYALPVIEAELIGSDPRRCCMS